MEKIAKKLFITIVMTCLVLSVIPTIIPVKAQDDTTEIPVFVAGACGPTDIATGYSWSMPVYTSSSGDYYTYNALENLFQWGYDAPQGTPEYLKPILATNWTINNRPDEMTAAGFMAYSGVDYMDITLRENVKFHDGSDWNATVCRWNINSISYILGDINNCLNSTQESDTRGQRIIYWLSVYDWKNYATASWNLSTLTAGLLEGYGMSAYAQLLYTSVYTPGYVPRFKNVTILDDKVSGGTVRVYFNDWGRGPQYLAGIRMISMQAYANYFDKPIMGFGQNPAFPQGDLSSPFPGHLIGTGPYIFKGHNFLTATGRMLRNDNWWNATAQQAEGWHLVPEIAVECFAHNSAGYAARTTALVTGDVNYATDRVWEPIEYSAIAGASGITYFDKGIEPCGEVIVLNCIDETYLKYWSDTAYNLSLTYMPKGYGNSTWNGLFAQTINASGVNRVFRKAISYAYDYDTYITTGKAGRAVRSGGLIALSGEYYDASVPLAYHDLTIARTALLTDPYWSGLCALKGLTMANLTAGADWNKVATSGNPVFVFEYHYDEAHVPSYNTLVSSLHAIGCEINATLDTIGTYSAIYAAANPYSSSTFPIFSVDGLPISPYHSRINDLAYQEAYYRSPAIVNRTFAGYVNISDYAVKPYPGDSGYYLLPGSTFPSSATSNLGFNYNVTCNNLIMRLWMSNATGSAVLYKDLATWCQDYQYPALYLSNEKTGYVVSDEWKVSWQWLLLMFSFNFVKYVGTTAPPGIPGYSIGILLPITMVILAGIAFRMMRQRKVTLK